MSFTCSLPYCFIICCTYTLRDKYVKKNVLFEDPLFPASDSSLFYSEKPPMKFEWKRPSVSHHKCFCCL
uniref:Calpain catalytic domain-containing protein n=1 Tax=Periophthalmus magnuspinnatus TaxID=409849 RepID=A0A3B4AGU1_9GOBI